MMQLNGGNALCVVTSTTPLKLRIGTYVIDKIEILLLPSYSFSSCLLFVFFFFLVHSHFIFPIAISISAVTVITVYLSYLIFPPISSFLLPHKHSHTHIHTHIYRHKYTHALTHMHTHTHILTHVQHYNNTLQTPRRSRTTLYRISFTGPTVFRHSHGVHTAVC